LQNTSRKPRTALARYEVASSAQNKGYSHPAFAGQVVAAYTGQALIPAAVGAAVGAVLGNMVASAVLAKTEQVAAARAAFPSLDGTPYRRRRCSSSAGTEPWRYFL
jgi:hypothetical protein